MVSALASLGCHNRWTSASFRPGRLREFNNL
jgi:hypothetical protein